MKVFVYLFWILIVFFGGRLVDDLAPDSTTSPVSQAEAVAWMASIIATGLLASKTGERGVRLVRNVLAWICLGFLLAVLVIPYPMNLVAKCLFIPFWIILIIPMTGIHIPLRRHNYHL